MKILRTVLVVLALSLLGAFLVPSSQADEHDKRSIITISTPFEIPGGQILPAGTYVFSLFDSESDRHVVQIWNADGSQLIATVLAIDNIRLTPTDKSVMLFSERPGDQPNAIKVWFYPGDTFGQEFVYPKTRAQELADAGKEPVPALTTDSLPVIAELKTTPLISMKPGQTQEPLSQAQAPAQAQQLPKTASLIPLIALLGAGCIGLALVLKQVIS